MDSFSMSRPNVSLPNTDDTGLPAPIPGGAPPKRTRQPHAHALAHPHAKPLGQLIHRIARIQLHLNLQPELAVLAALAAGALAEGNHGRHLFQGLGHVWITLHSAAPIEESGPRLHQVDDAPLFDLIGDLPGIIGDLRIRLLDLLAMLPELLLQRVEPLLDGRLALRQAP